MNGTDQKAPMERRVDEVPEGLEVDGAGRVYHGFEDGSRLSAAIEGPYGLWAPDGRILASGDTSGLITAEEGYPKLLAILAIGFLGGRPRGASWLSASIRSWAGEHSVELRALADKGAP